jgi:uncharacterized membrane protein
MATLLAIIYPDPERARQVMESVKWHDFHRLIDVKDACWVAKDEDGLKVHPWGGHVAGKAVAAGGLGLLVGGLFGLPVVGLAAGAAVGVRRARQVDAAIDDAFVAEIGEQLEAGGSAIFVLGEERPGTDWTVREVAKFGGTLHSADIPPDRLARFQAMLDQAGPGAQTARADGSTC